MAAESSVYLSGDDSLEELYELLKGGFVDDDVDFNKESDVVTSTEKINEKKKKVFRCAVCGKECIYLQGLKRHATLNHVLE